MSLKRNKGLVCGVGRNDATYLIDKRDYWYENGKKRSKLVWCCPFYRRWSDMLNRCYNPKRQHKGHENYKDCSVIEEWLLFSNFKSWMEKQNWEGQHLDKDFLVEGNKEYGPETCVFIPNIVNTFINTRERDRGEFPLGVCYHKASKKLSALCSNPFTKKQEHLGLFTDPLEAHEIWRRRKEQLALQISETPNLDERVVGKLKTMYSFSVWYNKH